MSSDIASSSSGLGPFLVRAAHAGVVAGSGVPAAFDTAGLASLAVTTLHESRAAVDSRVGSTRQELADLKAQLAAEVEARGETPDTGALPRYAPSRFSWLLGWFRRRPVGAVPPVPAVSCIDLVLRIAKLEARSRELAAFEGEYGHLFKIEFEAYRTRAAALPIDGSPNMAGGQR